MSSVAETFMLGAEICPPVADMFMLGANMYPL